MCVNNVQTNQGRDALIDQKNSNAISRMNPNKTGSSSQASPSSPHQTIHQMLRVTELAAEGINSITANTSNSCPFQMQIKPYIHEVESGYGRFMHDGFVSSVCC